MGEFTFTDMLPSLLHFQRVCSRLLLCFFGPPDGNESLCSNVLECQTISDCRISYVYQSTEFGRRANLFTWSRMNFAQISGWGLVADQPVDLAMLTVEVLYFPEGTETLNVSRRNMVRRA